MGYDMYAVNKDEAERALVAQLREQWNAAIKVRDDLPKEGRGSWDKEALAAHVANGGHPFDLPANATREYREAQEEVQRLSAAMDAAEKGYFRLNIWGMSKYRDVMIALGAARMDYERGGPEWPKFDPARTCWITTSTAEVDGKPEITTKVLDPEQWFWEWQEEPKYRSADYVEPGPDVVKLFEAHQQAIEDALAWRPDPLEDFRIPVHKFGSNDGWLVTSEEAFFAGNTLKTIRDSESERFYTVLGAAGISEPDAQRYFDQWIEFLLVASERGGFKVH